MSKLIVVGDMHVSEKTPKLNQFENTMDYIINDETNIEDNDILFLGDIYDVSLPSPSIIGIVVSKFLKLKHRNIFILTGNHETATAYLSALDSLRKLDRVTVLNSEMVVTLGNLNCLLLPHYVAEGSDRVEMYQYYNSLMMPLEFDYGFTHLEDSTSHFGDKYLDDTRFNVKQWLNGHVHTCNIQKGGHYLGSACKNSSAEKDDIKYIAIIDEETKGFELVGLPSFLDYATVKYPNDLSGDISKTIYSLTGVPSKREALEYYTTKYGRGIFTNKITSIREEMIEAKEVESESLSEEQYMSNYCDEAKVSSSVKEKCLSVIKEGE